MNFKQVVLLSVCGLAAIFLVPLLIFSLISLEENAPHPSDQSLTKIFFAHEADFGKLVNMSNEDSHVVRIASDFTWLDNNAGWPRPDSELGFSKQRWDEYRSLFSKQVSVLRSELTIHRRAQPIVEPERGECVSQVARLLKGVCNRADRST